MSQRSDAPVADDGGIATDASLQEQACARKAGRPRSPGVDKAIIDAALAVLLESGVKGLSIDAVAVRAGVARTSVYRRWPAKEPLIVDAVETLYAPVEPLPGISLRDDLLAVLAATRATFDGSIAGQLIPRLLVEDVDPLLLERIRSRVIAPRRGLLIDRLNQAIDDGEIAAGTDVEVMADLIVGPTIWRFMTRRLFGPVDADYGDRLIDIVLGGVLAAGSVRVNDR